MTDQGTNKTGFARDDELKKEIEGELKATRAVRPEEEFEPESSGQDQALAEPGTPVGTPVGAPPAGMTPQGVALRSELARHLDRSIFPAKRAALLGALHRHQAPDALLDRVASLPPDEPYPNVQAVIRSLGFGVEVPRA
jgi:hypothetical protein